MPDNLISVFGTQIGDYAETTDFSGHWYTESDNGRIFFANESDVMSYIEQNKDSLSGTTIDIYAFVAEGLVMQNVAEWKDGLSLEQQVEAMDARDGKKYFVAKLADGNVWMTQNLDLDLDSNTSYTNLDTDLGWNPTTHSYDTASWTPLRSTYSSNARTWCQGGTWNNEYNYCRDNYTPESFDPGDLYWNGKIGNYSDWSSYLDSCISDGVTRESTCDETKNPIATYTTPGVSAAHYHLGNFYNWNAAVASNDSSNYGVYEGGTYPNSRADRSICPAGWSLPGSDYNNMSFQNVIERYGWDIDSHVLGDDRKIWESPIYFAPYGYWHNGILNSVGNGASSWSSIASGSENAYVLYLNTSEYIDGYIDLDYFYPRSRGNVVRCVTR